MERKVLFYWLAQLGGWGAYFIFSVFLLVYSNDFILTLNLSLWVTASILIAIITSHGIRFTILKWNWLSLKLAKLIIYSIILALFSSLVLESCQLLLDEVFPIDYVKGDIKPEDKLFDWATFAFGVSRSLILFMLWMGFYYVFVIIEKSRKQEILNLKWEASNNEIELKNLRAQLNPHFLFNSLNSIRALVGIDPEQSKSAITKLSGLLRQSINLGKLKTISLKDELEIVDSYLQLEQIRFEERLEVKFDISDSALNCEIPPLMLQTIVENGIKHGISKSIDGGIINVKASFEGKTLCIETTNTGKLDSKTASNGVGIANTKRRLNILFGDDTEFSINQESDLVKVTIKITYQ